MTIFRDNYLFNPFGENEWTFRFTRAKIPEKQAKEEEGMDS